MSLRLHPLSPRDRLRVREILDATSVFRAEEVGVALELFDDVYPAHAKRSAEAPPVSPDYEFVGAFAEGDRLDGYACFGPTPGTDGTYDLYWIAMDPASQQSGGGSALLSAVEQQLSEREARLVVVETSSRPDYGPARRFYERRGYTAAARLRDFYAPNDDRIVYVKRLTPVARSTHHTQPVRGVPR